MKVSYVDAARKGAGINVKEGDTTTMVAENTVGKAMTSTNVAEKNVMGGDAVKVGTTMILQPSIGQDDETKSKRLYDNNKRARATKTKPLPLDVKDIDISILSMECDKYNKGEAKVKAPTKPKGREINDTKGVGVMGVDNAPSGTIASKHHVNIVMRPRGGGPADSDLANLSMEMQEADDDEDLEDNDDRKDLDDELLHHESTIHAADTKRYVQEVMKPTADAFEKALIADKNRNEIVKEVSRTFDKKLKEIYEREGMDVSSSDSSVSSDGSADSGEENFMEEITQDNRRSKLACSLFIENKKKVDFERHESLQKVLQTKLEEHKKETLLQNKGFNESQRLFLSNPNNKPILEVITSRLNAEGLTEDDSDNGDVIMNDVGDDDDDNDDVSGNAPPHQPSMWQPSLSQQSDDSGPVLRVTYQQRTLEKLTQEATQEDADNTQDQDHTQDQDYTQDDDGTQDQRNLRAKIEEHNRDTMLARNDFSQETTQETTFLSSIDRARKYNPIKFLGVPSTNEERKHHTIKEAKFVATLAVREVVGPILASSKAADDVASCSQASCATDDATISMVDEDANRKKKYNMLEQVTEFLYQVDDTEDAETMRNEFQTFFSRYSLQDLQQFAIHYIHSEDDRLRGSFRGNTKALIYPNPTITLLVFQIRKLYASRRRKGKLIYVEHSTSYFSALPVFAQILWPTTPHMIENPVCKGVLRFREVFDTYYLPNSENIQSWLEEVVVDDVDFACIVNQEANKTILNCLYDTLREMYGENWTTINLVDNQNTRKNFSETDTHPTKQQYWDLPPKCQLVVPSRILDARCVHEMHDGEREFVSTKNNVFIYDEYQNVLPEGRQFRDMVNELWRCPEYLFLCVNERYFREAILEHNTEGSLKNTLMIWRDTYFESSYNRKMIHLDSLHKKVLGSHWKAIPNVDQKDQAICFIKLPTIEEYRNLPPQQKLLFTWYQKLNMSNSRRSIKLMLFLHPATSGCTIFCIIQKLEEWHFFQMDVNHRHVGMTIELDHHGPKGDRDPSQILRIRDLLAEIYRSPCHARCVMHHRLKSNLEKDMHKSEERGEITQKDRDNTDIRPLINFINKLGPVEEMPFYWMGDGALNKPKPAWEDVKSKYLAWAKQQMEEWYHSIDAGELPLSFWSEDCPKKYPSNADIEY